MTYTFEVLTRLKNGEETRVTMKLYGDTSRHAEDNLREMMNDDLVILEFKEIPTGKSGRNIVAGRDHYESVKGSVITGSTVIHEHR